MKNLSLIWVYAFVMFNVIGMITTVYLFIRLIIFVIAIEEAAIELTEPCPEPVTTREHLINDIPGFECWDSVKQERWIMYYKEYSYLKFEE